MCVKLLVPILLLLACSCSVKKDLTTTTTVDHKQVRFDSSVAVRHKVEIVAESVVDTSNTVVQQTVVSLYFAEPTTERQLADSSAKIVRKDIVTTMRRTNNNITKTVDKTTRDTTTQVVVSTDSSITQAKTVSVAKTRKTPSAFGFAYVGLILIVVIIIIIRAIMKVI